MNTTTTTRLLTRFERNKRFRLKPKTVRSTTDTAERAFEQLKARLLHPVLDEATDASVRRQLRLAANEAAAIAWTTPFPLLVLPELLQEKAIEAREYARRQEVVHEATQDFAEAGP